MLLAVAQHRRVTMVVLSVVVLLGALCRLYGLSQAPISETEIWVPGIQLPPYDFADPQPRLSLGKVLTGTVAAEPHPPAYYVLMLGWTQLFGTGLFAIRFPSALFGIASIGLIYAIARLEKDQLTGLLAAGMLALHGFHVFWSQEAKMYALACVLSLLSTWCLLVLCRSRRRPQLCILFYAATTLLGLATVVYFWLIFVAQLLWVGLNHVTRKAPLLGVLRWQILLCIVASPLWSVMAYQSRRASYLTKDMLSELFHFLQFGYLLGMRHTSLPPSTLVFVTKIILCLFVLFFLMYTFVLRREYIIEAMAVPGPPPSLVLGVGVVICCSIFVFAYRAHRVDPSRTNTILVSGIMPLLLCTVDCVLRRSGGIIQKLRGVFEGRPLLPLSSWLVIVPFILLVLVSFFTPLFVQRGTLVFMPYMIIALCDGILLFTRYDIKKLVVIMLFLIPLQIFSVQHYRKLDHFSFNNKKFYDRWYPKIAQSDVIFVRRNWTTTPIFYYLKWDQYRFIGLKDIQEIAKHPDARVWVFTVQHLGVPPEVEKALAGYAIQDIVDSNRLSATLYTRLAP